MRMIMLGGDLIDCTSIVFEIDAKALRRNSPYLGAYREPSGISMCCPFDVRMLGQTNFAGGAI
jgi:hypothetical protein